MKKLLLIIIVLCTTHLHSQDSTKLSVKQVYEDAKVGIQKLVENLGGPAKHIYSVYTYQHRVEGVSFICAAIFCLIFGLILFRSNLKNADWSLGNLCVFLVVIGVLLFIAGIISTIIFFGGDGLTKIINPEYFAIKDIICAFK